MKVAAIQLTTDNSEEILQALEEKKDAVLEALGMQAENYAKLKCPVDTGNLRNSITHARADEDSEVVGTNVEYAAYVELGTHSLNGKQRTKPQPYLRPALENHKADYQNLIKNILST